MNTNCKNATMNTDRYNSSIVLGINAAYAIAYRPKHFCFAAWVALKGTCMGHRPEPSCLILL